MPGRRLLCPEERDTVPGGEGVRLNSCTLGADGGPMRSCLVPIALLVPLIPAARPTLLGAPAFHPAKYREGALPELPPPTVVGGGEVMLELDVTSTGAVRNAKALRTTPPYTAALIAAARSWRFVPAEVENENPNPSPGEPRFKPVDSTVLL